MASTGFIREKGKKRGFRTYGLMGLKGDVNTGETIPWRCELTGTQERREVWRDAKRVEYAVPELDADGKPVPFVDVNGKPMGSRKVMRTVYATSLDDPKLAEYRALDGFVGFEERADGIYVVREFILTDHLNGTVSKSYTFREDPKAIERRAEKAAADRALAELGRDPELLKKLLVRMAEDGDAEPKRKGKAA